MKTNAPPICMTIAGLDPSGGAGVTADIKTFFAFGCYGAEVVSSVTYQNTKGVYGALHQTGESVRKQAEAVFDDLAVVSVKTGMLPTEDVIAEVSGVLRNEKPSFVVVDPVVRSTSGFDLIDDPALDALKKHLFPLADIVTPNLAEAERITGMAIDTSDDFHAAASAMLDLGAGAVLIKGGHTPDSDTSLAIDRLFTGEALREYTSSLVDTKATHGTGCTLSSAIAASLAKGENLETAVETSKRYVTEAITTAAEIGGGHSPVNHWAGVKILGVK